MDCLNNFEQMAKEALEYVSPAEHAELLTFLDQVLDGDYTSAELKGLLNRSVTDIYFRHGDAVRHLLNLIRDRIRAR